jgi:hypothetical protein
LAIQKQEFYEGAALYRVIRSGAVTSIRCEMPFFLLNERVRVTLKYSTKGRSPWGFTFMPSEQVLMEEHAQAGELLIGLICGSDGVVVLRYEEYRSIATPRDSALRIACFRKHGKHYSVKGPDGRHPAKVSPSAWRRILEG